MKYWLAKSEPDTYSWDMFVKDGVTIWSGVRNYAARNNLKAMNTGDQVFFYHSNQGKEIVGIAEVSKAAFQDPTTTDVRWLAVELKPLRKLNRSITLEFIKRDKVLKNMLIVNNSRLSVSPVNNAEAEYILKIGV